LIRSTRCMGERGFALLTQRCRDPAKSFMRPEVA